jgi:hypothetical protein
MDGVWEFGVGSIFSVNMDGMGFSWISAFFLVGRVFGYALGRANQRSRAMGCCFSANERGVSAAVLGSFDY